MAAASGSLLGLDGEDAGLIRGLLRRARQFSDDADDRGEGRGVVANLFFEDSTRTRLSFSIAARGLGLDVVDLTSSGSSMSKGESVLDTARTVAAMGVAVLVVRSKQAGAPKMIADAVGCPVVNAGDGRHEHPTQGLLDIYTLAEAHGRLDGFDLADLHVAIVGDVVNSRVARSDIAGMTALGARVTCVGPPELAPDSMATLGCGVTDDLDGLIESVDAVVMLRVQRERGAEIGSIETYRQHYAMTTDRLGRLKPGAIVMHPGPMNRGVEIDHDVAESSRCVALRQVTNGVRVRMAVLERCIDE
jgi:aspartate carbamoyltransferase catalytic subunit